MAKWLLIFLFSTGVSASTLTHLTKSGEGEMTYLFWTLYRAELFVSNSDTASFDAGDRALRIEYFKDIDKHALIEATAEQWQHLGYQATDIQRWMAPLTQIWPDVAPGDVLTLVVADNGLSHFYFGDNLLGVIEQPDFGEAFLSIWLSEKTSEPELRRQLLGLSQ
ncbi:chalcone isomerase family protein [Shewanella colwelliana]|uniref:chalcone isomerase family protein n=1 Tax=Shewanella colwelliana TaxID=23 RepID=UPI0022AFD8C1|nr:chalcone isomerase family protein [Shewanella colwelliana]MCZ4336626.1 chalcone isomerase family protein [Shewanella colwelliana]MDX1282464.1 chalcone isomerase family protein [Shewanella colwelliana]